MKKATMEDQMDRFAASLRDEEREESTIQKYLRDIRGFLGWLDGGPITKEAAAGWKERLLVGGYRPTSVNNMLSSLNRFLAFLRLEHCRVKYLRVQRRLFRSADRELSREEYQRLLAAAQKKGQEKLALLIEAICATGIRVSEVRYLTVEAARMGRAEIFLKGKVRVILLPNKLCRKLAKYSKKQGIGSGGIFLTRTGRNLSRRQIWASMKQLCAEAGVAKSKVFPHNLRHLFARTFYQSCRDVAKLADVLGHSSIETTRLYLVSTGEEHARQLERLHLIS